MTAWSIIERAHRLAICLSATVDASGQPAIATLRLRGDTAALPVLADIAAHVGELHALLTAKPEMGECWLHRDRREQAAALPAEAAHIATPARTAAATKPRTAASAPQLQEAMRMV